MTERTRGEAAGSSNGFPRALRIAMPGILVAGLLATICLIQTGASLGTFICGLVIVAAMVPAISLAHRTWTVRLIACSSVTDTIGITWLVIVFISPVTVWQWLGAYIAMLSFAMSLAGMAWMLASFRIDRFIAATITSIVGFAWLSWPIWLSAHLEGDWGTRLAGWLVFAHPVFSINALLSPPLEVWTQMPMMYRLTALGQDIAYQLPGGVGWCIAIHTMIGAIGIFIATRPTAASKDA